MIVANATELFMGMQSDLSVTRTRQTGGNSPQQAVTYEAMPCRTYELRYPAFNIVGARPIDIYWAVANVLHFFTGSEEAGSLRQYNKHAERFLTGDRWHGAYGAIALPQIERCVELLRSEASTRRAIVSMGEIGTDDINRPACWSFLQFLHTDAGLNLCVYQRSLNLYGVMPYDCLLLSNILHYVAKKASLEPGRLYWTVGSLHNVANSPVGTSTAPRLQGLLLPVAVLDKPTECAYMLEHKELFPNELKNFAN